jgi:hypothetical protein
MKLRAVHLLVILIGILMLSTVLGTVREGMTTKKSVEDDIDDGVKDVEDKASEWWNDITGNKISEAHKNNSNSRLPSKPRSHSQYVGPAGDVVDVYSPNKETPIKPSEMYPSYNDTQNRAPREILRGIPRSQIPPGDEDLYILKSQVVPPVCPACPPVIACPKETECPPCRPCGRCPEPSFECKKVPNYNVGMKNEYLPRPVLADFSQFGM